jgi:hypothetical protein
MGSSTRSSAAVLDANIPAAVIGPGVVLKMFPRHDDPARKLGRALEPRNAHFSNRWKLALAGRTTTAGKFALENMPPGRDYSRDFFLCKGTAKDQL